MQQDSYHFVQKLFTYNRKNRTPKNIYNSDTCNRKERKAA